MLNNQFKEEMIICSPFDVSRRRDLRTCRCHESFRITSTHLADDHRPAESADSDSKKGQLDIQIQGVRYLQRIAAVKSVNATFWIEDVKPKAGGRFDVLQYTQTIIFDFFGINWPHITVATLFRL